MQATRTLTADELEHYHEQGYVVIEDFFPLDELDAMNRHLDEFFASGGDTRSASDTTKGWIFSLGLATEKTRDFCSDPRVLDLIEPIVYPGISIYSAKLVTKEPYDDTQCLWHQDDAYYTKHAPESQRRMSTWIPLQDTTREQGCVEIVPGSHKRGLQPSSNKGYGTCSLSMDIDVDLSERMYLPIKAGSIMLFSALLWHASEGNKTGTRRRAFIVSYQEGTVKAGNGPQYQLLREP